MNVNPSREPEEADRQRVVLVVEDQILVRNVVAEVLRTAGYVVIEAANAAEAIDIFVVAGTTIDLVFSDVNMPGPSPMDGVGLAHWISQHHPGVHVILTSGNRHAAPAREVAAFLQKPYRVAEALLHIRALLEDPQQGSE